MSAPAAHAAARLARTQRFTAWLHVLIEVDAGGIGSPEWTAIFDYERSGNFNAPSWKRRAPARFNGACSDAVKAWEWLRQRHREAGEDRPRGLGKWLLSLHAALQNWELMDAAAFAVQHRKPPPDEKAWNDLRAIWVGHNEGCVNVE